MTMTIEEKRAKQAAYMRAYMRKKKGRELGNPGRPANTPEVLWSKVDVKTKDECWPWKGYVSGSGYGRLWIGDQGYYAHRVIFNLANPNMIELAAPTNKKASGFLMHSCDNRICCNPSHLKIADLRENNRDCLIKGRKIMPKGEDHHRSVFTNEQIGQILKDRLLGKTAKNIAQDMNKNLATVKSLLYRNKSI